MILQFLRAIFGRRPIPPIEIAQPTTLADLQREYDTLVKPAGPLYKETRKATPNVTPRKKILPTHILLHHTSGAYAGSVSWCMEPKSRVSYHCIVSNTGKRTTLAEPTMRTWHAGISEWKGRKNCNDFCVGVAFEGDTYLQPPSEDALMSAAEYLEPIMSQFDIPVRNIIRHADVAPGRKNDCSVQALDAMRAIMGRVLK
jgi:N-acetyl-anhydromuramyl-L-alanine amidase AmpD